MFPTRFRALALALSLGSGSDALAQGAVPSVVTPRVKVTGPGSTGPIDGMNVTASGANGPQLLKDWLGATHFNVSTVAALRAWPITPLVGGAAVRLSGYTSAADGGGGEFVWSSTSTASDNGCTVVKPTGASGAGRWLAQLPSGSDLPAARCGVKADFDFGTNIGTDNTAAMQAAINLAQSAAAQGNGLRLILPPGQILIGPLTIAGQIEIVGAGSHASTLVLRSDATAAAITVKTDGNYTSGGYPPANVHLSRFRITGQTGRSGNAAAHGLAMQVGTVGAWVRADELAIYNLPGSGVASGVFNGFAEFTRSSFRGNGQYGADTNSTVDWRYIDCDFGGNIVGNIRSSGDAQQILLNPNIYSSNGHGLIAFQTDLKIIGGLIDRNRMHGISIGADPRGAGRVALSGGTTIGGNSRGNPGVYSDIAIAGAGSGLLLSGARFNTSPRAVNPSSDLLNNINIDPTSTATVVEIGTQFAGTNTLFTSGVSNAPTKVLASPMAAFETYTPTMGAAAGPGPSTFVSGANSGRFQLVGKRLTISLKGTVTTRGNGVHYVFFMLPAGLKPAADGSIPGITNGARALTGQLIAGNPSVFVRFPDGTYPGGDGTILTMTGTFEVQ